MGPVDADEPQSSVGWDAEAEEFVVGSYLDVANLTFLEISALLAVVHSLQISFVMVEYENLFAVNADDESVVVLDGVEALNLCHWEVLSRLARIANGLAAFAVLRDVER